MVRSALRTVSGKPPDRRDFGKTSTQWAEDATAMTEHGSMENAALLEQANRAGLWFRARKSRPIWARRLSQPERIVTLEGEEWAEVGSFVCRGAAGELWPQSAERLQTKYRATGETEPGGWQRYEPRPEDQGVWAARIEEAFMVRSRWGTLQGKPGDYLLTDAETPGPGQAMWIVDAALFSATYERLGDGDVL